MSGAVSLRSTAIQKLVLTTKGIIMEFELFCYAAMILAILYIRREQCRIADAPVTVIAQPIEIAPVEPLNITPELIEEAVNIIVSIAAKPKKKRPAAKGLSSASCTIPVDTIAPADGWNLDKNGRPLSGAALVKRKRKLGIS